jgi:hypothetical protein
VREACGTAHHWRRVAQGHGHRVTLLPVRYVKPYLRGNKTDRTDVDALFDAVRIGHSSNASSFAARLPIARGDGSSSSPPVASAEIPGGAGRHAFTCTKPRFSAPSPRPCGARISPSAPAVTRCATRSRHTCWRTATTSARCRNCSATPTSARR